MTAVDAVVRDCGLPWMPVGTGPPPADADGWGTLATSTRPPALRPLVATVLGDCEGRRDVASAFVAARFAVPLARLAVLPVLAHRRILAYSPEGLWLRLDARGLVTAARVVGAALDEAPAAAPGRLDEAPATPGEAPVARAARPAVPGAAHAAAAGRAVAGYRPLVAGLRALGGLGERALWGQLADAVVSAVGTALAAQGAAPTEAQDEALRWLRAADPPLWVRPEFAEVGAAGHRRLTWRRGSCCLAYRLAAFGLCSGCPLQSRAQWLAAAAGRSA